MTCFLASLKYIYIYIFKLEWSLETHLCRYHFGIAVIKTSILGTLCVKIDLSLLANQHAVCPRGEILETNRAYHIWRWMSAIVSHFK